MTILPIVPRLITCRFGQTVLENLNYRQFEKEKPGTNTTVLGPDAVLDENAARGKHRRLECGNARSESTWRQG